MVIIYTYDAVIKINRFVHNLRKVNIIEHKKFCDCLKIWRKKAKLTQRELAKALGVQFQTVWRWEHGEREPSLDILKKLCEILGITESELLNGPSDDKVELVVSWDWSEMKNGEISMDANKFKLILGEDGKVGLHGAGMITSRDAIEEFLGRVRNELEIALDAQIKRGVVQG